CIDPCGDCTLAELDQPGQFQITRGVDHTPDDRPLKGDEVMVAGFSVDDSEACRKDFITRAKHTWRAARRQPVVFSLRMVASSSAAVAARREHDTAMPLSL